MDRIGLQLSESPNPPANDTSAGVVAEFLDWVVSFVEVESLCAVGEIGLGFVGEALLAWTLAALGSLFFLLVGFV